MPDGIVVVPASEDTAEETQLRSALEHEDNQALGLEEPDSEPKQPEDEAKKSESQPEKEQKESDSSEPEAEHKTDATGRLHAKDGKFAPKIEKGEIKPLVEGEPEPVEQPKPAPDKDQERIARSWKKIEQEKLEVRNALAEIRQLKEQLAQQALRPPQEQVRFGSKRLMMAADEFERQAAALMEQGDVDQAKQKLALARDSRGAANREWQQEQAEAQQQQATSFSRDWQANAEVEIRQHPELGEPNSEAAQAMMELLEDYPILGYIPDGFSKGVEILRMRQAAASSSELRTENEKLKTEIKELREKTAISGGGITTKVEPTDFDNMTLDQQEAYLIRQARQEDFARTS